MFPHGQIQSYIGGGTRSRDICPPETREVSGRVGEAHAFIGSPFSEEPGLDGNDPYKSVQESLRCRGDCHCSSRGGKEVSCIKV